MSWPNPSDYQDAMQNPQIAFLDSELQAGKPTLDNLGLPRPITGGFAIVYEMNCSRHKIAVRCFLHNFPDQQKRYDAISQHLQNQKLKYAVSFVFQSKGIRINGQWYPILKMEWVEGKRLNEYIESILGRPDELRKLAVDFQSLVDELGRAGIAHGDLQHGNILVTNVGLKLIDYDGMFVPQLRGMKSNETGYPSYQHPKRTNSDFGPHIDRFPALAIYTSIKAIAVKPELWAMFNNDDNILFRRDDFLNPRSSDVFSALLTLGDREVSNLASTLQHSCIRSITDVPELEKGESTTPMPPGGYVSTPKYHEEIKPVDSFAVKYTLQWTRPDVIKERHVRQEPVYGTYTRQVPKEETVKIVWLSWLLFILIWFIVILLTASNGWWWLIIIAFIFSWQVFNIKGKRVVMIGEDHREQIGTKDVEFWSNNSTPGHVKPVLSISFSSDERIVYSGGSDGYIYTWESVSGNNLEGFQGHSDVITSIASLGNDRILTGSFDHTVKLWRAYPGSLEQELHVPTDRHCYAVAISPDRKLAAGGFGDQKIYIWNLETGELRHVLRGHTRRILAVAFHPDGKRLVSASADMTVSIWTIGKQNCDAIPYGHTAEVNCLAVSPDGRMIASGGNDGAIFIWDSKIGKLLYRINAKAPEVFSLVFLPDNVHLFSGGSDGIIHCWNVKSGKELAGSLNAHSGAIRGLAITTDGKCLVSCGDDCTVRLWEQSKSLTIQNTETVGNIATFWWNQKNL